jgi:plasmid segregation protein ParM
MLVSVDVGSGLTKWKSEDRSGSIPSAVGNLKHVEDSDFTYRDFSSDQVSFKRSKATDTYVVGEAAHRLLEKDARENTLCKEWFQSPGYRALLYRALANVLEPGFNGRVRLCVGLPQQRYDVDKPALVSLLTRVHAFSVGGNSYRVEIKESDLFVVPQAMGVYLYYTQVNPDSAANDLIGVVDVGTFTTGYSLINGGIFIRKKSGGLELGIASLAKQARSLISSEHGVRLDLPIVEDALREGNIRIRGKSYPLGKAIKTLAGPLVDELTDALQAAWGEDSAAALLLLAGGGADYVLPAMRTRWPHASLVADKQQSAMVIVEGYDFYLSAQG